MSSQPAPSTISRTLPPLWAERLSITCPTFGVGAKTTSGQASKTSLVVEPSTAKQGPTHRRVMLASSVTFLPQFLGALPKARLPLRDQAYSPDSETLAPISSTKTSRLASASSATRARQAALRN